MLLARQKELRDSSVLSMPQAFILQGARSCDRTFARLCSKHSTSITGVHMPMSGSNPPFNPKVDIFMPLYIGRYLQDTPHLDALKSGAYLHLLMHIWVRGPLPNDPAELATIAKCTPDAWSMCQASVMHYFKLGSDGMLHQGGAERLKGEWIDKRVKAHEKAQKAANARWGKYKAKKAMLQALPEQCPTSVYEEQVQELPPPTPSAARRGMQAKPPSAPSIPNPNGRNPAKSKAKAKPPKSAAVGPRKVANGAMPHPGPKDRVAVAKNASNGHAKNAHHPPNGDLRQAGFEREILEFWERQNPEHPKYLFSDPDRRALRDLLKRHPALSLPELRRMLRNRAQSEINPAAPPHKWLRDVIGFSAGPLGKYGKPLRAARVL
jgi:uncharacterized protein YdaU (DUF1376 family)